MAIVRAIPGRERDPVRVAAVSLRRSRTALGATSSSDPRRPRERCSGPAHARYRQRNLASFRPASCGLFCVTVSKAWLVGKSLIA